MMSPSAVPSRLCPVPEDCDDAVGEDAHRNIGKAAHGSEIPVIGVLQIDDYDGDRDAAYRNTGKAPHGSKISAIGALQIDVNMMMIETMLTGTLVKLHMAQRF